MLFFGRDRDTEVIAANLQASRFTVLYGPIGVGKSSVLRAGVARRLRSMGPDAAVVVHGSWAGDPVQTLLSAAAEAMSVPDVSARDSLADGLAELTAPFGGDLYLILDQFEEVFMYRGAARFTAELPEVLARPDLRVHVLIALREDALAELDVFKGRIPNVFGNYLALDPLDRRAGRDAIVGPLARYNELVGERPVEIEPELVEAVLDEVAVGRVALGGVGRGASGQADAGDVEAPFVQLVMQRLWEAEADRGSRALRLATLQDLGGADAIVRAHLERAVEELAPSEKDVAARIFNHLVTPSGTKVAHGIADLAQYAGVAEDDLRPVLSTLGAERIVRPLDGRFEIFHDVLADAVLAWRTRHDAERALELQREAAERRHRRLLILFGIALVALAAVAAVAIYALSQRSEARRQAGVAREQASIAQVEARNARARQLDAEATSLFQIDPELSLLLAAEAARRSPTPQAADILRDALLLSKLRGVLPPRGVRSAEFSPDGTRIVVGTERDGARIYSADGRRLFVALETGRPVSSASFSPDGRLVVTTSVGGPARLWQSRSGALVGTLARSPRAAAFDAGGSRVLTVEPSAARVWRTADRTLVATLRQPGPVRAASFGPTGRLVVTVGSDRFARVFQADSGALLAAVDQGGAVTSAAITPNARLLVTTGRNETARLWSLSGRPRLLHELEGHVGQVTSGVLDARGKLLVTTSTDGTARIWQLPTGRLVVPLIGHTNRVTGAAFSRDGFSIVTTSTDGTARVWQPARGSARALLAGHLDSVTTAVFNPSRKIVLTVGADGTARIWDPQLHAELRPLRRIAAPVAAGSFSADGAVVAIAGRGGVSVYRVEDGRQVSRLPTGSVRAVAVSSDGSLVAAASARRVSFWRTATRERLGFVREADRTTAVAFAPDARRVAVGTADGSVRVWSVDGRLLRAVAARGRRVMSLAFSPGGDRLAGAFADGTAAVWSARDGRHLYELAGHTAGVPVMSVAFSSTGRRIVTASRDRDARTWDAETGKSLLALRGHFAIVSDASFSRDGRWVVTAGPGTAGVWNAVTGQRKLFLRGHRGRLVSAAFDAAGRRIATVGADGTLRSYTCAFCGGIGDLLPLAERRLAATGRQLTPSERRRYFGAG